MLRNLLLYALGAYTLVLAALEARSGAAAVRPYLLDAAGPPFAHVQATLSLALLLATAILLGVTGRVERLSGRQTTADRRIGAAIIVLLVAVAIEDRFRLVAASGSIATERAAWIVLALVGSTGLIALSRSRLGRSVPRWFWLGGAAGFAATYVADAAGSTWLVVEDVPRLWGAAFLLLAAARMLEESIAEATLAGPAGSAWELGRTLGDRKRAVPRLTELATTPPKPSPDPTPTRVPARSLARK